MVIRSPREFRFVLLPFWAIVAIFFLTAPIAVGLELGGQHNLSALFVATSMGYVLSYEWLHLAYTCRRTASSAGSWAPCARTTRRTTIRRSCRAGT